MPDRRKPADLSRPGQTARQTSSRRRLGRDSRIHSRNRSSPRFTRLQAFRLWSRGNAIGHRASDGVNKEPFAKKFSPGRTTRHQYTSPASRRKMSASWIWGPAIPFNPPAIPGDRTTVVSASSTPVGTTLSRQSRTELQIYGDVKLGVMVELDPILKKEWNNSNTIPVGSTTKQSNQRKDTKSAKAITHGAVRCRSQWTGGANRRSVPEHRSRSDAESKESQEDLESVIGHSATLTKGSGLIPRRVSFTSCIPETYYDKVHQQRELAKDSTLKDIPPPG